MSDSDDDMPPPLEDMSQTLQANKEMRAKAEGNHWGIGKTEDHAEEVRLAPKKDKENVSKIAPSDNFDFDKKKPEQKPAAKKNQAFGGFSAGFLNAKPQKKTAERKPEVEDHTNVKAQKETDRLKLKEVQEAMTNTLEKNKNDWLTPEFMLKLQQRPKLMAAFADP
jgi:hypothetical protein